MEDRSIRILDLKKTILEDNDADADLLRSELKKDKTFYLNLMSSPGSGKTTTLKATIAGLRDSLRIGVMEADIDSDVDAKAIAALGIKSIQVHTGGMCHLDDDLDLVILENVGNLVCPAEFDTGACKNAVILSIPEGDDKPLKYPLMFEKADVVLVNKIDALPVFDFDLEKFRENVRLRNACCPVFPISAATGEGVDAWCAWLLQEVRTFLE